MMKKLNFIFLILLIASPLFSQTTDETIFDEGAEVTINPNDIGEDVILWAQNTAIKLKELLVKIKTLSVQEKKEYLIQKIKECVLEAQNTRELLLMRFALNRALKLSFTFFESDDELIVHYILLPIIKEAIYLYERADLPYLTANQNKPIEEIEVPSYAAFSKAQIGYLLTISNMNKSPEGQFEILKLALVWITNDLLRSAETKRNPVNANLILNLKELYFKYEKLPTEEITHTVLNRIRALLLKTYQDMIPEKGKIILPFIIYTPSQPDLVFESQKKEEEQPKPKAEPTPKIKAPPRIITDHYAPEDVHMFRLGIGAGFKNNEPILNISFRGFSIERGNFKNIHGSQGVAGHVFKGDFDISNNKELDRQDIEVLGFQVPFIPVLSPQVKIGPYFNFLDFQFDEAKKVRYIRWLNMGLASNIQPLPSKNFTININTYWAPHFNNGDGEPRVKLNDFNLSDASTQWQAELKQKEQEHYDGQTAIIKASEDRAQYLLDNGWTKEVSGSGTVWILSPRGGGIRVLSDGDRTPFVNKNFKEASDQKIIDSWTTETKCTLVSSWQKQNDLVFECGGYWASHLLERFSGNFPSVHKNEFDPTSHSWGAHVGIEYRLWDQEDTQLVTQEKVFDNRNEKPFNLGPTLHLSYQVDNDPVGKEIMDFFNPEKAKDMITQTRTAHFYIKFDF